MSRIDLHARHDHSRAQAREAADRLARSLAGRFGMSHHWEGDTLQFERPGVHGQIRVQEGELWIQAHLGFMLQALRRPIERTVIDYLTEHYGCRFSSVH